MRIRQGFVSNSSSSSFICKVSGRVEAGYDMIIDEAGMYCCENYHYFDEDYLVEPSDNEEDSYAERIGITELDDELEDDWGEDERYVPANRCPICTMEHISDKDILDYVIKSRMCPDRKSLSKEMKEKYGEYKNFQQENK